MKRIAILGLVILAMMLLPLGQVQSAAVKTTFMVIRSPPPAPTGDPDRMWVSDGILHFRNWPFRTGVEGEIEGPVDFLANANIDLATGNQESWGPFTFHATWRGMTGTFEGRFTARVIDGVVSSRIVGHGTGDFEGMKLFWVDLGDGVNAEVTILNPHG